MNDLLNESPARKYFNLHNEKERECIQKCSYALASPERIRILQNLTKNKNLSTLAKELKIPPSSLARHIDILADAGLVHLYHEPGPKGHVKYVSIATLNYTVHLVPRDKKAKPAPAISVELPIGLFSHCHIERPCGMLSKEKQLIPYDDPSFFFFPERTQAEALWFDKGFISYNFPTPTNVQNKKLSKVTFSFEICSETDCYNNDWPSDITVFINKHEILTFTSPGDFGGRRGIYTPSFWPITATQFGMLKTVTVTKEGIYLDEKFLDNHITFDDLKLFDGAAIQLTIGIKDDAVHKGGINLFGKNFGDYPQAIIMELRGD